MWFCIERGFQVDVVCKAPRDHFFWLSSSCPCLKILTTARPSPVLGSEISSTGRPGQGQIVRIVPSLWLLVVLRVSVLVLNHSSIRFVIKLFIRSRKSSWMTQDSSISNWSWTVSDRNSFEIQYNKIFYVKKWLNLKHSNYMIMDSNWIIQFCRWRGLYIERL